jgi:hypothetical protein
VCGTARYEYDDQGRPKEIRFYSHHPVLAPTLFRLYARILGYENWVPRSFMLILSLFITWVLFLFVRSELKEDRASAFLVLLYTLLPLNFMYLDQWKEMNTGILFVLLCFYLLSRMPGSRIHRILFLICFFLLFQSQWVAYYTAPFMILLLYRNRKEEGWHRMYAHATLVGFLGVAVNFAVLYQLGLNLEEMRAVGAFRTADGMDQIGISQWLSRQWRYLPMNFGEINLAFYVMGMVYLFVRKRAPSSLLFLASLAFTVSLICHAGLFRNLSWIHHYVQWPFAPAYILLIATVVSELRKEIPAYNKARGIRVAVMIALLVFTAAESHQFENSIRGNTFGHASDLEAIRSLQQRLIVFSDGRSGPPEWWLGTVMDLARDPLFQGVSKMGPVERVESLPDLDPKTDVLVVLNDKEALASLPPYLHERFGIVGLRILRSTQSFTFFEMLR